MNLDRAILTTGAVTIGSALLALAAGAGLIIVVLDIMEKVEDQPEGTS